MKKIRKIVFCFILILISITGVSAKTPTLCERDELDNNGVNKHWKITDKNILNVKNAPCVDASEKIYDFEEVLTDEEYNELKRLIDEYVEKTKMDLVIVIKDIPYSNDSVNEDYAADFYDYNDFGIDFKNYSGTLLLRNTYAEDPYYDMYAFGDAQLYYDYNRMQNILDGIYNDLHSGNYYDGFKRYISYLNRYYAQGYDKNAYVVDRNGYVHLKYHYPGLIIFLVSSIVTLVTMIILVKKNKMVMKATKAEQYLDRSNIKINNREDQFISTHTTSYTISSDSGGGFGGGGSHSSSGSSGGGHSSGGGRHG